MMVEVSDAVLVRQSQAGDKAAFSLLVARHLPRVKRLLFAILRHPADVDDLLQETLLQAYLSLDSLRQPERFRAWVCGIGINLARMRLRSYLKRPLSWDELAEAGNVMTDGQSSPERVAEQREITSRLNQVIADLPPAEREALLLVYGDGLSHQETADRLGTSLGAVKVRVHRGRNRLQAILQPEFGEVIRQDSKSLYHSVKGVDMIKVTIHDVLAPASREDLLAIDKERLFAPLLQLLPEDQQALFLKEASFEIFPPRRFWEMLKSLPEERRTAAREAFLPFGQYRIVFLKEEVGDRVLPIWIGPCEADAILIKLTNESLNRPISFDLIKTLLDLGAVRVERAAVSRLHEEIFYGTLFIRFGTEGSPLSEVDCRVSDALNLAARMNVPIFVADEVMAEASITPDSEGRYTFEKEPQANMKWRSLLAA